ncbi:survival protein sure-like phosphatase/nucleotidase [Podospora appendiculata]|uniref:Survival protein sure-like phosphatase/nucleotidase n=1 Tax=Podospora appendiculata TaxID=314037 RepID=A0AAE0X0X1_9PEZI|nr:survival protein sure-like phosphatase/nucleotidase [Podospora appendiculata]
MHILIVNDDGPPSPHSSPYVHSLVRELQAAGHVISVCLPHTQRSWIGKAHMIGQTVKPTYYRPPPPSAPAAGLTIPSSTDDDNDDNPNSHGTTHTRPSKRPGVEEWILVDGTPASCVQIGLYHFFKQRGPIDLVVSGPNYGRNTTAVFALSSGTLGGALEAAVCRRRAIALSYAFFTRNHDPVIIAAASKQSVRVIEALAAQWPTDGSVDLYSVNVPLLEGLENGKVLWTGMLQNYWGDGSCFTEVEGSIDGEEEDEERIREAEGQSASEADKPTAGHDHKHFKWSPRFTDVYKSVDEAPPGNDGWAVKEGHTSVTPLKANFWHPATHLHGGELQLTAPEPAAATPETTQTLPIRHSASEKTTTVDDKPSLYALIDYGDTYVQPLILSALEKLLPANSWKLLTPSPPPPSSSSTTYEVSLARLLPNPDTDKILQIGQYEELDFDFADAHPATCLINSYVIRKALVRKHFLSATVENWTAKHPDSVLRTHVQRSEAFELDYAEFLDDALVEAFDLRASLERNAAAAAEEGGEKKLEWWILKPSMSDRGQGIRLFSTMEELQAIFDGWEADLLDSEEEEEEGDEDDEGGAEMTAAAADESAPRSMDDAINSSHLRHFVAQPYIDPPLLLPALGNRKFHVRVYVLTVGGMRVYVYKDMLALFAAKPYQAPGSSESSLSAGQDDLAAHLTNTCLQGDEDEAAKADAVHRFWDLPLPAADAVFEQICAVTGEVFEAAARGMVVHFQPLEQAFEVFGLDFLVDAAGVAWLMEINAFPDFKQTGRLTGVVAGFWEEVLRLAVLPFAGVEEEEEGGRVGKEVTVGQGQMVLVREVDLGRRRWG